MELFPKNLAEQLDFNFIIDKLTSYCIHNNTKKRVEQLKPSSSFDVITTWLNETYEAFLASQHGSSIPHQYFPIIDAELSLLRLQESVLAIAQFVSIRQVVENAHSLLQFLHDKKEAYPQLFEKVKNIKKDQHILEHIHQILHKEGYIHDTASDELFEIRKSMKKNRLQSDAVYKSKISQLKQKGYLADFEEGYIQGRRVLSILAEYKRQVKGNILSYSSSGKIAFIEPSQAIQYNDEKLLLEGDEKNEINNILKKLTDTIRPKLSSIKTFYKLLIDFDLICAKAALAKSLKANKPIVLNQTQKINYINAIHPVLFLQNESKKLATIPFTCQLHSEKQIMIISGPNAGGKSITLKSFGLLQIMLQCGMLIPVSIKSEIGIIDKLFGDIGDHQSIEDGLSTYSSRLLKMKYFLNHANNKTLFLIDEFGTGSDPDLGGALAEIILHDLADSKAMGIITTHFTNLKLSAAKHQALFNACMLYQNKSLQPRYILHVGEPGSSFTFEVAEKIGLSKELIERAKKKVSKERVKMDQLLHSLHTEKSQQIKLKRDLQKQISKTTAEKRNYQELKAQLEEQIEKNTQEENEMKKWMAMGKKLNKLTIDWVENKNKKEVIHKFVKLAGYELHKQKEQEAFEKTEAYKIKKLKKLEGKIQVGSKVKLLKSKEIGTIQKINNQRANILIGNIEINIGLEKIELIP
ncbi:MAG: hypothetical protein R2831_12015 [Chitinophagaceae bacterium]